MLDLDTLIDPAPVAPPPGGWPSDATGAPTAMTFHLDVPDGVLQARGAWGGVAAGALVRAAAALEPGGDRVLRSLGAHLVAPLPAGRHRLRAEVLRRGTGTTTVAVRLGPDGDVVAHGVAVLGVRRVGEGMPDGTAWQRVVPPAALEAGWRAVPAFPLPIPPAPEFAQHLEYRPLSGIPYTRDGSGEVLGWIRPLGRTRRFDDGVVAALADAWWVVLQPMLPAPRPVGTLSFALDVLTEPAAVPVDADGRIEPLLHRGRLVGAREGYTVETRELWTADGRLLSWNTQTVAVVR